jgi:hypothetical protein
MASDESLVKSDESSSSGITWAHLPAGPPLRQCNVVAGGGYRQNDVEGDAFDLHDSVPEIREGEDDSFLALVKNGVPDISAEALTYLDEAVAAFYADCLLASCVMLGVAAEAEFLRLTDIAAKSTVHGATFAPVQNQRTIRQRITKFHDRLQPLLKSLSQEAVEDLETNFLMIQSVLRIARNEAGHPTAVKVRREQVYVYLQLFVPFARQLMRLRVALQ